MQITKFEHSCFYLEKDGRGLLFDPVEFNTKLPEFDNIDVIIITHKHGDHYQPEVLSKIRARNPNAQVFATEDNPIDGARVTWAPEKIQASVFELQFYGSNFHACIVRDVVPCQNLAVMVDNVFANAGDSLESTAPQPDFLTVPVSAPWLKTEEAMDFIVGNRPKIAVIPRHDALCSNTGLGVYDNWLQQACDKAGVEYRKIHFGKIL
ncbi:MBL fold metallo-hydrolase [Candidatus Saccharibacteria bacterium]|nr:MBL fold metallo-hydrolase [Candidatus Saccharibacteria bacterium]MCL1962846.1 MBL fold metallo-hydrolase [Candidatus Saccharibacteria bacterium]